MTRGRSRTPSGMRLRCRLVLALAVRRGWSQLLFNDFENGWGEFTTYPGVTAASYWGGTIDCEADDWKSEDYCHTFERADSDLRGVCCDVDDDTEEGECWEGVGCEYAPWSSSCVVNLCWSGPQNGDHTDGEGHYLYAKAHEAYTKPYTQYLESSFAGGEGGVMVQFWYTMWRYSIDGSMGNLSLEAFDGAVWSRHWGKEGYQGTDWLEASVPVAGNVSKIRFVASVQSDYSDIAIDDVSVVVAPTPSPTSMPSQSPSHVPTAAPSMTPVPSPAPSPDPSPLPTALPTALPSAPLHVAEVDGPTW